VDVPHLRAELAQEAEVVDALVAEVARVEVEAEARVVADGGERAARGDGVEGDFGGMDFEREADVRGFARREDGPPRRAEARVAVLDLRRGDGREGVEEVPDRAAREADDDGAGRALRQVVADGLRSRVEEAPRRLDGVDHLRRRALADAVRAAVAPDALGEDGAVALVDGIADGLADEVIADGEGGEAVVGEELPLLLAVVVLLQRALRVEVVSPARELEAVVAESLGLLAELLEREVGPLAGEEADGAGHGNSFRST